jgi:hypothetical protein
LLNLNVLEFFFTFFVIIPGLPNNALTFFNKIILSKLSCISIRYLMYFPFFVLFILPPPSNKPV